MRMFLFGSAPRRSTHSRFSGSFHHRVLLSRDTFLSWLAIALAAAVLSGCVTYGSAYTSEKVTICHKNKKTLVLPESAISAHLGHGDTYGPCG